MGIINAQHYPGRHCASTALCNLVNYHGIRWSEALCFGIGCGLGIWYLENGGESLERIIHVRSEDIEEQFFTRIGRTFQWSIYADPGESESDLCAVLDEGRPAMVQSDIYHLPYYNSGTHFPGHVITVWGYDVDRKVFYVTDTERENMLEVPFEAMRKARYSKMGFFTIKGNMYAPENISMPDSLPAVLSGAIIDSSRRLMDAKSKYQGIQALKTWIEELDDWKRFNDWKWTARFTYQVIEKRGTGGGGFRLIYAEFLKEAASLVPQIPALGLPELMREAARAWSDLARALKGASEREVFDAGEVRTRLEKVLALESRYHESALRLAV
ncbi:MAG TPA: BtrH N-terminal domain-containing protein [Spirochaetota bacterium]|nr:BtrH N-terminal domain-containing protein [Spirochaetota bacterium]